MINIAALASGSNGNSYFFEDDVDSLLVDVGVSCKQIVQRMDNLNLRLKRLGGIFITHEHSDHIRGLEVLAKNFEIPMYMTKGTYENSKVKLNDRLVNLIEVGKMIQMGTIKVLPFEKHHDAAEPCSFMLNSGKMNVSVMTDIGRVCPNVIEFMKKSNAVFLESNYDEHMLENGGYPYFLKKRVSGEDGHLSNYQAALAVVEHAEPRLKNVILSHLSANNNTPELAFQTFSSLIKARKDLSIKTHMTSREKESPVLKLE